MTAAIVELVTTNAEIVRARRVLAEAYRRITDYPSPRCVISELEPAIVTLEAWIASGKPHLR